MPDLTDFTAVRNTNGSGVTGKMQQMGLGDILNAKKSSSSGGSKRDREAAVELEDAQGINGEPVTYQPTKRRKSSLFKPLKPLKQLRLRSSLSSAKGTCRYEDTAIDYINIYRRMHHFFPNGGSMQLRSNTYTALHSLL